MRLLNSQTLEFAIFDGDDEVPAYAILSHTWGEGEISFLDMMAIKSDPEHAATESPGYAKIVQTCKQAMKDNILYVWVDTCRIDKTSSAELSEAINTTHR